MLQKSAGQALFPPLSEDGAGIAGRLRMAVLADPHCDRYVTKTPINTKFKALIKGQKNEKENFNPKSKQEQALEKDQKT